MSFRRAALLLVSLLMALPLIIGTSNSTAQSTTTLSLNPTQVPVGGTTTLDATLTCNAASCNGFAATLSFDAALVRVDDAALGPYLGQNVFGPDVSIDNSAGTVTISAAATQTPPATGALFTLTLTGLAPGDAALQFTELRIEDASGSETGASGSGTTVSVTESEQLPPFQPPVNSWEVAFVSERDGNPEIYAMNADGTGLRRLTQNSVQDGDPTWSPSGNTLAYHTIQGDSFDIVLIDPDGSNPRRLTSDPADDIEPAWSPDGTRIAFVSERDGNPELYTINADGSSLRRLTNDPARDTHPAWSPDGQTIVFVSDRTGSLALHRINPDGSGQQQFTGLFGASGAHPDWNPSGTQLAFDLERDSQHAIYTVSDGGQNAQEISDAPLGGMRAPAWSPNGDHLAYALTRGGTTNLVVRDLQQNRLFSLTNDDAPDTDPDWRNLAPPQPCVVQTEQAEITIRVGPGANRGVFAYLPRGEAFNVVGKHTEADGTLWFKLDKTQFDGSEIVNSLWVRADDIRASGDCETIPANDPPPLIPGDPGEPGDPGDPGDGWGECGSCETCGYDAGECVESPTGECVWDPTRCSEDVPGDTPGDNGDGCYVLSTRVEPEPGAGIISYEGNDPCEDGGYEPGSTVYLFASPNQGWVFYSWDGSSCPISGGSSNVSFTITGNCTAVAEFTG